MELNLQKSRNISKCWRKQKARKKFCKDKSWKEFRNNKRKRKKRENFF